MWPLEHPVAVRVVAGARRATADVSACGPDPYRIGHTPCPGATAVGDRRNRCRLMPNSPSQRRIAAVSACGGWLSLLWQQEGSHAAARWLGGGIFLWCIPSSRFDPCSASALASTAAPHGNHLVAADRHLDHSNPITYVPPNWFNYPARRLAARPRAAGWPARVLQREGFWEMGWSFSSGCCWLQALWAWWRPAPFPGLLVLAGARRTASR